MRQKKIELAGKLTPVTNLMYINGCLCYVQIAYENTCIDNLCFTGYARGNHGGGGGSVRLGKTG
jgi:hypothetical protein